MRKIAIPIVLLAAAGGAYWYFEMRSENGADGALTLYGNVDIRQVDLAFRVSGRIAEMRFEEGDAVRTGDIIAILDDEPLAHDLAAAEAQLQVAAARRDMMEAGTRPAEVAQARALVEERRAAVDNARRGHERQAELLRRGHVSQQAYDDADERLEEAIARLSSAEEALALAEEGFRQEDIAMARAEMRAAEAAHAQAARRLDDTVLHAPSDGTILSRVREPGAIVMEGTTAYVLSLDRPVWVRAYVDQPDLGRIHPGMPVWVTTDTTPETPYPGQIGFISPVAEFTPRSVETEELRTELVYRLRIVVSEPDLGLRQGMPVTVHMEQPATQVAGG